MVAIAPGASSSVSTPILDFWVQQAGLLADPTDLAFAIFDVSTEDKYLDPVQVFPATAGNELSVDLVADKLGTGHFVADWTVPGGEAIGRHQIVWSWTMPADANGNVTSGKVTREFDVIAKTGARGQLGYALISDFRDEGITPTRASDARLLRLVAEQSTRFEQLTGRWFEPRLVSTRLNGRARDTLLIDDPIVGIDFTQLDGDVAVVETTDYRVYNRHLAGLLRPDDRESPKLQFFVAAPGLSASLYPYTYPTSYSLLQPRIWPKGTQNIQIVGAFGYTDPDGSPAGDTPALVRRAIKLMVIRELPKLGYGNERREALNANRIKSEKTREQSYELEPGKASGGAFTGDSEIDDIIERYMRPIAIGSTGGPDAM